MFQAYAKVIQTDPYYVYWNPIPGAQDVDPEVCIELAREYADKTWPGDDMAWRRARLIAEMRITPVPTR